MEYEINITDQFDKWHSEINDNLLLSRLDARFDRIRQGNFGDNKKLTDDLFELRFRFGGGFRVYYTIKNERVILLLCGGNKASQSKDIKIAKKILSELE